MQALNFSDLCCVSGGMSQTEMVCLEGTSVGAGFGAVLGALITSPLYYSLLHRGGISSSHHMAGIFVIGCGMLTGAIMGSMIGGGSSYLASCQLDGHKD